MIKKKFNLIVLGGYCIRVNIHQLSPNSTLYQTIFSRVYIKQCTICLMFDVKFQRAERIGKYFNTRLPLRVVASTRFTELRRAGQQQGTGIFGVPLYLVSNFHIVGQRSTINQSTQAGAGLDPSDLQDEVSLFTSQINL